MGRPKKKQKSRFTKKSLKTKMKNTSKERQGSIKVKLEKVPKLPKKEVTSDDEEEELEEEVPVTKKRGKQPYQMYTQEDLISAVKAVKEQGMSTYKAAELFGIPKSTVHDKVVGKSNIMFQRKGPAPLLSYEDEKKLVDYLLQMSNLGYMFTIGELRSLASELAIEKGKLAEGSLLSPRWHKSFRTRWPVLNEKVFGNFRTCNQRKHREKASRTVETFEFEEEGEQIQISTMADDVDVCLSTYYTELHMMMVKYEVLDKPHRIFCIDEVAIQYETGNPRTKPITTIRNQVSSRSESTVVSLIGCGNAIGNALPPFLVYPGKKVSPELLKGKQPGTQAIVTENGLTDYSSIKYYLEKHFMEYALLGQKRAPPVLVLYDGTKSKVNPDTIAWAKSQNIILFVLPPNTSNLTYPIEKGCFQHFKDNFIREIRVFREMYKVESIAKSSICRVVSAAYPVALCMKNLIEMFEDCGIYPYKPSIAVSDELRILRFTKKKKINSIQRRPPGMRDKGVQVVVKDDTAIKLLKPGRRRIMRQNDGTVVDVDSTSEFLRDKKIQKMLETNGVIRHDEESDFTESEYEDYEDDIVEEEVPEEVQPAGGTPSSYYIVDGTPVSGSSVPNTSSYTSSYTNTDQLHSPKPIHGIEDTHTYAVNSAVQNKEAVEMDNLEQTRVAVQALQDIANEIQYVTTTSMPNQGGTVQNVTLNSGRMIQVVVHTDSSEQIELPQDHVIEEVQQIEIDSSVESIIPMPGDIIENT